MAIFSSTVGRKISTVGKAALAGKLWLQALPTRDCDILVTFAKGTTDSVIMSVVSKFRSRSHLQLKTRHYEASDTFAIYFTASYKDLLLSAEDIGIRKELKPELGGGMIDFSFDNQESFLGIEDEELFLTGQERQSIVLHMLNDVQALEEDEIGDLSLIDGQPIVPVLHSKKIIRQIVPLHNNDELEHLRESWVQQPFKRQPLDDIKSYFGVNIALYFAWLGHYTYALLIPAISGILVWLIRGHNQFLDDVCFVLFGLLNAIWSTVFLEFWKRRSAELAYKWGTLDQPPEVLVQPRPLYHGEIQVSTVTGKPEIHYPDRKRNVTRYFVSLPAICLALLVVLASMLAIFELQEYVADGIKTGSISWTYVRFVPTVLLVATISGFGMGYQTLALRLNDAENYRLEETYENHLIIKLIGFQFVNSFLCLFYLAFYLNDISRLSEQLATILITRQIIGNVNEALVPYILAKLKQMNTARKAIERQRSLPKGDEKEDGASTTAALSQAEVESAMPRYSGTFDDYLEMFVQFGYVILFSSAFPLAAFCALLNNLIEIRSDAFKLCNTLQRPFGKAVENIGTWQDALEVLGVAAVMVNCALIGMSGHMHRLFPGMTWTQTLVFIVVLEHLILALKFVISYAIPDVPDWVAMEMAKVEFQRRQAVRNMTRDLTPPED